MVFIWLAKTKAEWRNFGHFCTSGEFCDETLPFCFKRMINIHFLRQVRESDKILMRKPLTRMKKVASVSFLYFSRTTMKTRSDFTWIFGF